MILFIVGDLAKLFSNNYKCYFLFDKINIQNMKLFGTREVQIFGQQILTEVQELLGKRQCYLFDSFKIHHRKYPGLSLCGFKYCIYLTQDAIQSETELIYQISHECVHLLSPVDPKEMTNFEEGVAVLVSLHFLGLKVGEECASKMKAYVAEKSDKYYKALESVEEIPNLFEKIKHLRQKDSEIKLSKFRYEHFEELTNDRDLMYYWSSIFKYEE